MEQNPLGQLPVRKLLIKFALPSIIAMLVSALYNIVDQFFIGNSIGELGNAATNVAFPLNTSCVAIALMFGIGGASCFNLALGAGKEEEAPYYIGNSAVILLILGSLIMILTELWLEPLLRLFGSPENVMKYAVEYTGTVAVGFPFLVFSIGGGHLIRADGSPRFSMFCNLTGAIINTILDAIFVFGLNMGMFGAAIATVIGQVCSSVLVVLYLRKCKTITLTAKYLKIQLKYVKRIISLGMAPFFNQVAMMVVQVVMNNCLTYYGSLSCYGESIPLACSGIIGKVNMVYFSFIIGISQGLQPIVSYNFGAKLYDRVKSGVKQALVVAFSISLLAFILFQVFPRQISSAFGKGNDMYFQFAANYFRVFLFFTFANFLQPICSNFFTAIGKSYKGVFLSLTRQIIFLLPLILLLPLWMGIDGIMYAGPVADCVAAVIAIIMTLFEIKKWENKTV